MIKSIHFLKTGKKSEDSEALLTLMTKLNEVIRVLNEQEILRECPPVDLNPQVGQLLSAEAVPTKVINIHIHTGGSDDVRVSVEKA